MVVSPCQEAKPDQPTDVVSKTASATVSSDFIGRDFCPGEAGQYESTR